MTKSQNQAQKAAYKGVRNFKHALFAEIKSNYIAKVIKYDSSNHLADIQPLVNLSTGQQPAQILDVPVSENCYIIDEILDRLKSEFSKVDSYEDTEGKPISAKLVDKYPRKKMMRKGVPVVVAVLDRDIDNWSGGRSTSNFDPETGRMHDINDSIVIGVLGGDAKDG